MCQLELNTGWYFRQTATAATTTATAYALVCFYLFTFIVVFCHNCVMSRQLPPVSMDVGVYKVVGKVIDSFLIDI
jgi:hypothetical protein